MSKIVPNYWPSLLLSLVLLAGIVACLKRLDYLVVEEVRALISILFGFATSCLLLSFIWLIQRKPLNRTWPHQHITIGAADAPSMHPRGRINSADSYDSNGQVIISTVSSAELDIPPAYEEALVHSKPICRHEKANRIQSKSAHKQSTCSCTTDNGPGTHHQSIGVSSPTSLSCNKCLERYRLGEPGKNECKPARSEKVSFVQLDVGQLALSSSPPKYHELQLYDSCEPTHSQQGEQDKTTIHMA